MDKDFKVLRTSADTDALMFTNYRINKDGVILTRKGKVVPETIDKNDNSYYVIMINGRAYKKTLKELLEQNF